MNPVLIVLALIQFSTAKNILYVSLAPSPSHSIWDQTLAMALRNNGHSITYVTHFPVVPMENFTTIIFEGVYEKVNKNSAFQDLIQDTFFELTRHFHEYMVLTCQYDVETDGFKTLMKQAIDGIIRYDGIIYDISSGQCMLPIIEKFHSPPSIAASAYGLAPYIIHAFGISLETAYIPTYGIPLTENMNFFQRFYNYIGHLYVRIIQHILYYPQHMNVARRAFGDHIKHISDYERNFSVFLANYDPVWNYPQLLPPAVIPVGGLHVLRPINELPKDLKLWMDNSKNGVLIFSLGTNIKSNLLNGEKQSIFLDTFAQLNLNIIWKFESNLTDIPKNVLIRKYLPQNDLLLHPNVKLLINHGGALSTQEALYNGIPVISMPFFADQRSIAEEMKMKKFGVKLNYYKLSREYLLQKINTVLNNDIYRQNAQMVSRRYRDRPLNALDKAVFWTEHIINENGAKYLRLAACDMPLYQIEHIDIWIFISILITLLYFISRKIYKRFIIRSFHKIKQQ